ncbi:hypothetical protein [Tunturibacter empetritectus]|uniref:Uncharacterized protein n=1 Tax=Tunturiibacter lichenicola TaxID=2051959 RepID=A0A7W8N2J4_9BACT|nr:hypothetical protein [Edaphobacter lichenicola]MBB5342468.1 hypothetical protein [Edaphobacter lichenicola]
MGRMRHISIAILCVVAFDAQSNLLLSQASTPAQVGQSAKPNLVVSTNIALYAFLRVAATDSSAPAIDQARSKALILHTGLDLKDREILQNIFHEYATSLRNLHDPNKKNMTPSALQRGEVKLYVHVIQRLRTELSPDGLVAFRNYLENKKSKMEVRMRSSK